MVDQKVQVVIQNEMVELVDQVVVQHIMLLQAQEHVVKEIQVGVQLQDLRTQVVEVVELLKLVLLVFQELQEEVEQDRQIQLQVQHYLMLVVVEQDKQLMEQP